jgi:hypothetical protein
MYVSSGVACTFPNSTTPMSKARIARQDARVARVGHSFFRGNAALDSLVTMLGGTGIGPVPGANPQPAAADFRNSPGCSTGVTPITAGNPYGGRLPAFSAPPPPAFGGKWLPVSPLAMGANPGAASGEIVAPGSGPGVGSAPPASPAGVACVYPEVKPLQTVFPAKAAVHAPNGVATVAPMSAPAPARSKADPALCANITPDNVCEAARAGCFLFAQLDPQQWLACAQAGWSGNQNLYPDVLLRGGAQNGKYFGMVNANPKSAAGSLPNAPGLGGLSDIPGGLWIAGAALLGIAMISKKGRR